MSDSNIDSGSGSGVYTSRLLFPDLLKGVAVILMIQVHLMELFATQELYDSFWGKVSLLFGGPPAAPVFMAVMGYFLAISGDGMVSMFGRGIKLIVYGLFLNTGLNLHLLYRIFIGESPLNPRSYIFGVDILFLAGLSIIAIALFRRLFSNRLIWWLLIMVLVATAGSFIPAGNGEETWGSYLLAYFYKPTWWSYFPLIPWLAYPLAGYCFRLFETRFVILPFSLKTGIIRGLVLFVLLLTTFSYGFNITADLQKYYHHDLLYFFWVLLFLIFWLACLWMLFKYIRMNPVSIYLQWVGRNVTAFYVFQWLIIGNLATSFYKSVSAVQLLLWFAGITLITGFLVWTYRIAVEKYRDNKGVTIR